MAETREAYRGQVNEIIGARIRLRRIELGIKAPELAKHIGELFLAKIESGEQEVEVWQLYRIAAHLRCDPADFLPKLEKLLIKQHIQDSDRREKQ